MKFLKIHLILFNMSTTKQEFGIENKLEKGLARKVDTLDQLVHPIEVSEKNFAKNTEKAFADNLRKMQVKARSGQCNAQCQCFNYHLISIIFRGCTRH